MYVCICHAIRERDVEAAAGQGACRAVDVHRHFGVRPKCGRCLASMREMVKENTPSPACQPTG